MHNTLEKSLQIFSFNQLLFFYSCIIKRLFPYYTLFSKKENWGNPLVLEKGLDILFRFSIQDSSISKQELEIINDINSITPDTEQFGSILATSAQDVCVMLLESLDSIKQQDSSRMTSLLSLALNPFRIYLEETYDLDYNQKNHDDFIYNHELMLNEIQFLETLVHSLNTEKVYYRSLFEKIEPIDTGKIFLS